MGEEAAAMQSDPKGGDSRYRLMYDSHYRAVLAYCLRRVGSADAQDAAAEVFTIAWRRFDNMPLDERQLPWLYGVAYRVLSHQWRAERRRTLLSVRMASVRELPSQSPDGQLVQRQDYELVRKAATQLKPLDREVLQLVMWEEMSHGQVAEMLGSTTAAVKQRVHRAKRRLAREFKKLGGTIQSPPVAQEGGGS
jgi:RNA polymerase sigma-70 factor (ECF subfamily)